MGTRVELFAQIRRDARVEELSIRELARRHQVGRATVRQALSGAAPPARKVPVRVSPRLGPFKFAIDAMLVEDLSAPRKQRHTARRVHARLIEEYDAQRVSYSSVRDYVRVRRAQIEVDAGRRVEVFIPQDHAPGEEAEVDFGEVWVMLAGVKTKCHMFTFRLSHSGKAVHRIYPTQGQEAFLEGHVEAFTEIGGVPTRHIRYDNLSSAVAVVIYGTGRQRVENERWQLFCSHYGFDAFYCQPGIDGAHEKGGVEGEVGRFRRNRLSPMPVCETLAELNDRVRVWDEIDNARRIDSRIRTVGEDFAIEHPLLAPLPGEHFDPGVVLTPRVDRSALVTVRMARYSVPAHLIGQRVRVSLRAFDLSIRDDKHRVVAIHPRVVGNGRHSLHLDHYLEVLADKPGALPGSTALAQARATGVFTAAHEALWAAARKTDGDAAGTRTLIEVLLLHRSMAHASVVAGIEAALRVGAISPDVVAVEARRHAATAGGSSSGRHLDDQAPLNVHRVVSLTQYRLADPAAVIAGLPADTRPLPNTAIYDQLLIRTSTARGGHQKETGT
ncbi:IS21 family transposase [Gordonia sp. NPDC003424]